MPLMVTDGSSLYEAVFASCWRGVLTRMGTNPRRSAMLADLRLALRQGRRLILSRCLARTHSLLYDGATDVLDCSIVAGGAIRSRQNVRIEPSLNFAAKMLSNELNKKKQ
ncbi:hypothetical protein F442_13313 [Phytophthora nicotianae P10297]|uniref:Uncharacterized protein n=2 Tax=Phytophthora nicotianae TaxID=4792 RepID=W2YX00_PHYNI|nr:hypothetical protein F444_13513 [Phytophthora nicotianae P1976]ETP39216.1 hypothetical protein F442_13313 [Phytophthora nicotianae P10297]